MAEKLSLTKTKIKKQPLTVLRQIDTNPSALKFVVSRMLTKNAIEFKTSIKQQPLL
jgi:hypothetical protein